MLGTEGVCSDSSPMDGISYRASRACPDEDDRGVSCLPCQLCIYSKPKLPVDAPNFVSSLCQSIGIPIMSQFSVFI